MAKFLNLSIIISRTVQGTIETIAYTLMPKNEVIALLASRFGLSVPYGVTHFRGSTQL